MTFPTDLTAEEAMRAVWAGLPLALEPANDNARPECLKICCYSPMACAAFGFCRERNLGPTMDLTPEGEQLVIPGAERVLPPSVQQGELF